MHRLLTKKHKDDDHPKTTNKLRSFKRNKSQPPPASRPQVDLTQALPPTDDFRISLMMPNLEKRFSVLRDGEKPDGPGVNGIGYGALASGTLFKDGQESEYVRPPFGASNLGDITEVASIRSGSRAEGSFDQERSSQGEDYAGNMMDRPRQTEGNVLFGGRQKVYRINTVATASSEGIPEAAESPISPIGRGRMGGRALYTEDLPGSGPNWRKGTSPSDKDVPRSGSPPPSNYNLDRNTQSSTNSGPGSLTRSSTTATSNSTNSRNFTPITPVHPAISTTTSKPRKLIYEQALDRDMSEQNSLDSQRLAIMGQRRGGSASPNPYSEEHEKMRAMSPPPRSYPRPFSPEVAKEPGLRGRSRSPAANIRAPASRDNLRQQVPGLRTTNFSSNSTPVKETPPATDIPFSFGFESKEEEKPAFPTSKSIINNHGLPTPRPESDEYQPPSVQPSKPLVANSLTPSPSPLAEKYPNPKTISQKSSLNLGEVSQTGRPDSKGSSTSNYSDKQPKMQNKTFFEASDSEHEMDDGASSVYDDDVGSAYHQPFSDDIKSSPPRHKPANIGFVDYQPEKRTSDPVSPTAEEALQDSDSPTLPPNAGLSTMIRQHLRSDSGISSIYAPSTHRKMSEPHPDPPSLAQALAGWDNQYPDYDEEAPFQPDSASDRSMPKPKYSLAELKKKEAEEKKRAQEEFQAVTKSAPMERKVSDNVSTGDDEDDHDEWRRELDEKKKLLQQRLQEHSGRNSPTPGFADANDEPPKNSILKPGMLGNMLKSKGSPAGTPMGGPGDSKAMKMLGISPMLNQSKESFKKRDEEDDYGREYHEESMRPMQRRPDMNGPPHDPRYRGPGPMHGQGGPRGPPPPHAQHGPMGRPYGAHPPGPQGNSPHGNGPRSFLPMAGPPPSQRRGGGGGHIPIETGMPPSTNMHREFIEGRGGPRSGPGMPPHKQHRSPPPHGYDQTSPQEFRPPHDRQYDGRGPQYQQGNRSRTRSNAQRPNDAMPRSPPQSRGGPMRRGPASEEDLRGRQRGSPRGMTDPKTGLSTNATTGTMPAPLNFEKKQQGFPQGKDFEGPQQRDAAQAPVAAVKPKTSDSPGRFPNPTNVDLPPPSMPQIKSSGSDSPQAAPTGRLRSNSKPVQYSSVGIFDMTSTGQPAIPPHPSTTAPSKLSGSPTTLSVKTLAELTGTDNPSAQFQSHGSAAAARQGKKIKIKKTDISEPQLVHTTSQMPVSNLIDAGGKAPKILPPGLGDSPQLRQRSGSDESASRIPRVGYPGTNQRTSDPEGERTRTLRKATSDGSGLRERAASSARSRPLMPEMRSPVYTGPGAQAPPPPSAFYNAPAGMI